MFGLGMGEMVVFGVLAVLLFGGKKLPELGSGLAKSIKNFKNGLEETETDQNKVDKKDS